MTTDPVRARHGATKAMALALLVVVGLAGMGLGFAAERLTMHRHRFGMMGPLSGPRSGFSSGELGPRRAGRPREAMRERFARELDLTPDQQRRVDSIMLQQTRDFRRLRAEMQPRFDSLLANAQRGLDSVLTPAQRARLEELRKRDVFGPRDAFGARDHWPPGRP
jgi:Spy/CpxP family protein refolding chaperone